jgi:hypothetical protein
MFFATCDFIKYRHIIMIANKKFRKSVGMKNNKIEGEIQRSVNLWSVFYLFSKPNLILKISSFVVITDKLKFSVHFISFP